MSGRSGFSLIELLVVLVVIAVLAGMLLPAIAAVRATARQVACASQQRQIGIALLVYANEHDALLPPRYVSNADLPASWLADPLYSGGGTAVWTHPRFIGSTMDDGYDLVAGAVPANARSVFRCPSDRTTPPIGVDYGLSASVCTDVWTPYGAWRNQLPLTRFVDIAAVAMLTDTGEARWEVNSYSDPSSAPEDASIGWGSGQVAPFTMIRRHRDGVNLLFADGHVGYTRALAADIAAGVTKLKPN